MVDGWMMMATDGGALIDLHTVHLSGKAAKTFVNFFRLIALRVSLLLGSRWTYPLMNLTLCLNSPEEMMMLMVQRFI